MSITINKYMPLRLDKSLNAIPENSIPESARKVKGLRNTAPGPENKDSGKKVVHLKPQFIPNEGIIEYGVSTKPLAPGWRNLTPFISAYAKVFHTPCIDENPLWILTWIKEHSAIVRPNSIPTKSLIRNYIKSNDPEKHKALALCEQVLTQGYVEAKEFMGADEDEEVQSGFEIVGDKDFTMRVQGLFGIEVCYQFVDVLLDNILEKNLTDLHNWKQFFKGAFAHEMMHKIKDEIYADPDEGQEIASHAVEILATAGDNPIGDTYFERALKNTTSSYDEDMITSLKYLQQKFIQCKETKYKPKSIEPKEISKSIRSIPEKKREKILKEITQELITSSSVELLRIAAQVSQTPHKREVKVKDILDLLQLGKVS